MQTNIIWTGKLYHSLEKCQIIDSGQGTEIISVLNGIHENHTFKVEYHIETNENWETLMLKLHTSFNYSAETLTLEKVGGIWLLNGKPEPDFRNIVDIDISLTPFTNSLPVKRLKFMDHQPIQIEVLYVDVFNQEIAPVRQIYTRLESGLYAYENITSNFKALIKIDEQGLVTDYPNLFEMTVKNENA